MQSCFKVVKASLGELDWFSIGCGYLLETGPDTALSFRLYHWLRAKDFNEIEFESCPELAFYSLYAKHLGLCQWDITLSGLSPSSEAWNRASLETEYLRKTALDLIARAPDKKRSPPIISVCTPHRNRPKSLTTMLESLSRQSILPREVVIVDDASETTLRQEVSHICRGPWAFEIQLIETDHIGARAARNLAALNARGDTLLFLDDDNYLRPGAIETYSLSFQNSDFDIYLAPYQKEGVTDPETDFPGISPDPKRVWLPLGSCLPLGLFTNVVGDMNALFTREIFLELGGLNTANKLACEDWEFLLKAIFKGAKIGIVPEILTVYREHPGSFLHRAPKRLSELSVLGSTLSPLGIKSTALLEVLGESL